MDKITCVRFIFGGIESFKILVTVLVMNPALLETPKV